MTGQDYDAIVIGTSQGGRFLPAELTKAGQKVALIERDQLGGVCVNRGCTPTKTMVASARLAAQARRGVRRAYWPGVGGPDCGARAQARHGRRGEAELRETAAT
jgi:pyruvate/2-oxoglutarate dehydrogenase complex dihydrolipoamide dehydrogenase (E3) component